MDEEQRAGLAWLVGAIVYLLALQSPIAGPTIAAIVTGLIVAALVRDAAKAFIVGGLAGGGALLLSAGAWIVGSAAIIASAGGGAIALLALAYHLLAPALLGAGFTLFFRG